MHGVCKRHACLSPCEAGCRVFSRAYLSWLYSITYTALVAIVRTNVRRGTHTYSVCLWLITQHHDPCFLSSLNPLGPRLVAYISYCACPDSTCSCTRPAQSIAKNILARLYLTYVEPPLAHIDVYMPCTTPIANHKT